jgi:hypothetical protein
MLLGERPDRERSCGGETRAALRRIHDSDPADGPPGEGETWHDRD